MFANLSINRDTRNSNIDPIYDFLLKNEPIVNNGIKILHNHKGTRLPTGPKRVASILVNKGIISQQNSQLTFNLHNFSSVSLMFLLM